MANKQTVERLQEIVREMKDGGDSFVGDYEDSHIRADKLLREALVLAATPSTHDVIDQIVKAWDEVGKWYA